MPAIRGITVSVGEHYAGLLEVTLVQNMRHLTECLVVTMPGDPSIQVARSIPGVRVLETDVFTRLGAKFNKGWGMELGFDELGRHGWILVFDADIILPPSIPLDRLDPEYLHGARRRILEDPSQWTLDLDWARFPPHRDGGPIGFFQLFSGEAESLVGKRPWYDVSFAHGGGSDAFFMEHFHPGRRIVLPIDCLHLGVPDSTWFGTSPEAREVMKAFVSRNGWTRSRSYDPRAKDLVGEIVERVEVPGYPASSFELPFVRRAKARR